MSIKIISRYGLVLLLVILLQHGASCQNSPYIVFYSVGDALHLTKSKSQPLAAGMEIDKSSIIKIGNDSKVVLVSEGGQNVVLEQKGKFSYQYVSDILESDDGGISSAYFSYVWKKFSYRKQKDPDKMPMAVVGGVRRADESLMAWPYDKAVITGSVIAFTWEENAPEYYLQIFSSEGKAILKIRTKTTSLNFYPHESGLSDGKEYSWIVTTAPNIGNQPMYKFLLPDQAWWDSYKNERATLLKNLPLLEDVEGALDLFDESKGIYKNQQNTR